MAGWARAARATPPSSGPSRCCARRWRGRGATLRRSRSRSGYFCRSTSAREAARAELHRWFTVVYRNPEGTDASGIHGTPRAGPRAAGGTGRRRRQSSPPQPDLPRYTEQLEALAEVVGLDVSGPSVAPLGASPQGRRGHGIYETGYRMTAVQTDPVKQQVAAHWGRRARAFRRGFRAQHPHRRRSAPPGTASSISCWPGGCRSTRSMPAAAPGFSASSLRRAAIGSPASILRPAMLAEARRKAAERGARDPLRGGRCRAVALRRPTASTLS